MSSQSHVPVHGNYHGYYSKRPFVNDPRLALLSRSLFDGASVLDVGCNEGWVTCEIAQSWGAQKVVGVDIDDNLVRAAWKRRRTLWSRQAPPRDETDADPQLGKRKRAEPTPPLCFPASCEHMFGPLPFPAAPTKHAFPHNVSFKTADWVAQGIADDADGYDVILAFSISKWIHLNGGDAAITKFFRRVFQSLKPGGAFVLEPQAWDTYGKAKRMNETLKENAKHLELRPKDFERVLVEIGFSSARHLGTTGEGGFHRPVDLYTKVS
ncbi:hypothetical protein PLICRDRAFT_173199 [Plicaturopsis crispa FD-325 SS-3]|nr:hypothetical protein PLICRDRAFT_173199 [Plicaturopsis crispa FD-325 SS-3]